jgi:hypothetical protein
MLASALDVEKKKINITAMFLMDDVVANAT